MRAMKGSRRIADSNKTQGLMTFLALWTINVMNKKATTRALSLRHCTPESAKAQWQISNHMILLLAWYPRQDSNLLPSP